MDYKRSDWPMSEQAKYHQLIRRLDQPAQVSGSLALNEKQRTIIDAALDLLYTTSLDELSLRDIAKAVHMQAPALYWHFKNKAVLIDFMAEAILQKEFCNLHVRANDEPWESWLLKQMLLLRKAMIAYPDGGRIVAGAHPYPAVTLSRIFECSLESLHSAGIPLEIAGIAASTAMHYTFGYVIEEQSSPSAEEIKNVDMSTFFEHTPYTTRLIHSKSDNTSEARYRAGMEIILAGINATLNN